MLTNIRFRRWCSHFLVVTALMGRDGSIQAEDAGAPKVWVLVELEKWEANPGCLRNIADLCRKPVDELHQEAGALTYWPKSLGTDFSPTRLTIESHLQDGLGLVVPSDQRPATLQVDDGGATYSGPDLAPEADPDIVDECRYSPWVTRRFVPAAAYEAARLRLLKHHFHVDACPPALPTLSSIKEPCINTVPPAPAPRLQAPPRVRALAGKTGGKLEKNLAQKVQFPLGMVEHFISQRERDGARLEGTLRFRRRHDTYSVVSSTLKDAGLLRCVEAAFGSHDKRFGGEDAFMPPHQDADITLRFWFRE